MEVPLQIIIINNNFSGDLCCFASHRPQRVFIIVYLIIFFFHFVNSFKFIPMKGKRRRERENIPMKICQKRRISERISILINSIESIFWSIRFRVRSIAVAARSICLFSFFSVFFLFLFNFFRICRLCLEKLLIVYSIFYLHAIELYRRSSYTYFGFRLPIYCGSNGNTLHRYHRRLFVWASIFGKSLFFSLNLLLLLSTMNVMKMNKILSSK